MGAATWKFFDADLEGESRIIKEIGKCRLSTAESVYLDALMQRIAKNRGIPNKDFKFLEAEDLWEVRFSGNKRIFRLLYSYEGNGTSLLLALHFLPKKSQKLPKQAFRTARSRRDAWRLRHK